MDEGPKTDGAEPKLQFRGCWCPPEIMERVDKGAITIKQAWLLLVVDSLVNHFGKDCHASNAYLGKRCLVSPSRVRRMISELKAMGLLIQTGFDGERRYLRAAWSRSSESAEMRSLNGSESAEMRRGGAHKCARENTKRENTVSAPVRTAPSPLTRWGKMARHLADAIQTVRKVNCSSKLHSWAKSFECLHTIDKVKKSRIRKALLWYCAELPKRHGEAYFLVIHSGDAFRKKFLQLEAAIVRDGNVRQGTNGNGHSQFNPDTEPGVTKVTGVVVGRLNRTQFDKFLDEN